MSKRIIFNRTGGAEVLEIIEQNEAAPKAGEVQIRVHAIGLNRAEIMYRNGQYVIEPQFPAKLGYEASGEVVAVGDGVQGFALGDRVAVVPAFMFTKYGTYGDVVNLPARALVKMPENQSWQEAAATWMQFTTAYGALVEFADVQAGDFVVVNAASSSVGVAAIQIANLLGATPIAVSRSSSKNAELLAAGAAYALSTSEDDIAAKLAEISGSKGVKMVFDPVGGSGSAAFISAMAHEGVYIQYGALSPEPLAVPVMDLLAKHLTIRGYELFEITTDDDKLARAKAFITDGLAKGALKPVIAEAFDFADIQNAHRFMEKGNHIGKIVVNVA